MTGDGLRERDALGRRRAQEEFARPLVLEAGAGTGKTATLVARVLAWSLGPGWDQVADRAAEPGDRTSQDPGPDDEEIARDLLAGVVAITFTEAAAAEMSTRVGSALALVAAGRAGDVVGFERDALTAPDGALGDRARALLANLDHLTVRTIHAFCRTLLATYPLESGVHPDFVVDADGSRRRAVLRDVLEDAILTSYSRDEPDALSRLAAFRVGPDRLFQALDTLLRDGARPELFRRDPFDDEGVRGLREEIASACRAFLVAGGASLRETAGRSQRTAPAIEAVEATLRLVEVGEARNPDPGLLVRSLQLLWDDGLARTLGEWRRGKTNQTEKADFSGDAAAFAHAAGQLRDIIRSAEKIDVEAFTLARRAVRDLFERTERELRARGIATFADLLGGAERLLTDEPAVVARERRRIDQLLVDEFQDTDPRQCTIVRLLALEGPEAERPGLFLVGDPKQSIYGWREADLEAYEDFLSAVEEAGGERHVLAINFRSTPEILAEVDHVMRPAMLEEPGLQPRYEPLLPAAAADPGAPPPARPAIEHWVSWTGFGRGPQGGSDEVAELEAEAVARDIERYRESSGAAWSDCAVLYRGRGQLEVFQDALRTRGIPYAVSRDVGYYRRREVIEAAAFARAVLNPTDHLALVTFLRSTIVGVPDAALLPLWRAKLPDLVTQLESPGDPTLVRLSEIARETADSIPEDIPGIDRIAGWEEALIAGLDLLAAARELFRRLPADRFVEALRSRSLFEASEAARYQGEYRLANLERFFRQLESALADPSRDVEGVLYELRSSIQIQPDAEEAKPQGPEEDSVQLMTIHVAKGLEFRSVWLVQQHVTRNPYDRPTEPVELDHRNRPEDPRPGYALFGWPTPFRHRAEARDRRVEEAERVRTLYVAMTRAEERLVVAGRWSVKPPPDHWRRAGSAIELVAMRDPAPPDLAELWHELAATERWAAVRDGVRWAFPALDPGRDEARRAPRRAGAGDVGPWAAEAEAHGRASLAAAVRSARPLHAAASALHGELGDAGAADPVEREAALLAGTLVHQAFERWRLDEPPAGELDRVRALALDEAATATPTVSRRAARRVELLFERLAAGSLVDRLAAVRDTWHARELALVAPPVSRSDDEHPAAPLEAITGSIDLVYRDPADGGFVIVDYKTDLVEGEEAIAARVDAYRPQLEVYREAVGRALPADRPPRAELWFLWPDRVVVLE